MKKSDIFWGSVAIVALLIYLGGTFYTVGKIMEYQTQEVKR